MTNFCSDSARFCVVDDYSYRIESWCGTMDEAIADAARFGGSIAAIVGGRLRALTDAQEFLIDLPSRDSNSVYCALDDAATVGKVDECQDWTNGRSTWTFADGSTVTLESADVFASVKECK